MNTQWLFYLKPEGERKMNPDQAQAQLQENEQDAMITGVYNIARDLGFKGSYETFRNLFQMLCDKPDHSMIYQHAVEEGYPNDPREFCIDLSGMIYHACQEKRNG